MCAHRVMYAALLTGVLPLAAALISAPTAAAAPAAAPADRTVTFADVTVRVPADWPVVDVDGVPGCVRYDQHAVYLGSPTDTTCPAHRVGRTTTVQILRPAAGGQTSANAAPAVHTDRVHTDSVGDLQIGSSGGARVIVTADPTDPARAASIAAAATVGGTTVGSHAVAGATPQQPTAGTRPGTSPATVRESTVPTSTGPGTTPSGTTAAPATSILTGKAFDTCSAPSLTQMSAWRASPYKGVGVYIGGVARGCAQPNLTTSWVSAVAQQGWSLLPIYVGLQAPCTTYSSRMSSSTTTAKQQGTQAAQDAATQMAALGLGTGNPVYLDMESWDNANAPCTAAVMAFTDGWTAGLHTAGYSSGFYSSASTGIAALVAAVKNNSIQPPDAIWFARWDGNAVTTDAAIPSTMWTNHQRAKQYLGGHDETYGGRTINIDSDQVDGPAAPAPVAMATPALPSAVPGRPYSLTLAAWGGVPPYTFAVTGGTLPGGLALSAAGQISGTPTTMAAPAPVTITVTDSTSQTASLDYSMAVTFTDVPTNSGFFDDIAWLANSRITNGNGDGSFGPTTPVVRQSMAAFLYRYVHSGTDAGKCSGPSPFPDVAVDSIFCGDIDWLSSQNITQGNGNGTFGPTTSVARQSMAAFLYRLTHAGKDGKCTGPAPFPDVAVDSIFCGDIAWLKATGISNGNSDGTFGPTTAVSRQAMAAFLHRMNSVVPR